MGSRLADELRVLGRAVKREWHFVIATFAASGVGYLGSAGAPVIVSALIESGLDYQQAGDLGTIELTMLAITSMIVLPYITHVSHRLLAIGGAVMAAAGLVISILSVDYSVMVIGRVLTGAGSGFAISGANAAIAARKDAERIFALIWTMGGGITASLSINLPAVVEGGKYSLGFGVLLFLCLAGLPFMIWVPPKPLGLDSERIDSNVESSTDSPAPSQGPVKPFGLLSLMALFGIFIYSLAEQALWNFAYTLPTEAGIDEEIASWVLGFTTLMGLGGGAIAAVLGVRFGRVIPIIAGSLLSVAGRWLYMGAGTPEWLFVGGLMWGLGFYFISPYQIGLLAAVDRHGRAAVAAGGIMNFGYALGPTIAGRTLQNLDADALLVVIVGITALSLVLILPLAIRTERMRRG